jgi:hypothetical protein
VSEAPALASADRSTSTRRDLRAGCFVCGGTKPMWTGGNAQGVSARHHDLTRHPTWCDVNLSIRYGEHRPDPHQVDLEDVLAADDAERAAP